VGRWICLLGFDTALDGFSKGGVLAGVSADVAKFNNHRRLGPFYLTWYDGKRKQMDPAGRDSEHAFRIANLKRAAPRLRLSAQG
jgi:hypothetical protein